MNKFTLTVKSGEYSFHGIGSTPPCIMFKSDNNYPDYVHDSNVNKWLYPVDLYPIPDGKFVIKLATGTYKFDISSSNEDFIFFNKEKLESLPKINIMKDELYDCLIKGVKLYTLNDNKFSRIIYTNGFVEAKDIFRDMYFEEVMPYTRDTILVHAGNVKLLEIFYEVYSKFSKDPHDCIKCEKFKSYIESIISI